MAELKGSNTEKNLQAAFAGESSSIPKYTFYASAARKAGMNEIADYFEETAPQSNLHMLNCGSKLFMVAIFPLISKLTFAMQQLVKTTNILQCSKNSLTKLKRRLC